jgi:hypothetical protein
VLLMKNSSKTALSGMAVALGTVVMLLASAIPTLEYAIPAFAGFMVLFILVELDVGWAAGVYAATALLGILQVFCGVGIVFCTVGSVIAKEAARDRNDADFNNAAQDKMRGFKIGGLAVMPMLAAGVAAVVLKILGGASAGFYWFYRWVILCPVKPIFDLLTGNATDFSGAPLWSVIVSVGFTALFLAFCGVMYIICYNEDSVIAKLLYKSAKRKKENVRKMGR